MNRNGSAPVTLLFAIGGLAVVWYFVAIIYLAVHPRSEHPDGGDAQRGRSSLPTVSDKPSPPANAPAAPAPTADAPAPSTPAADAPGKTDKGAAAPAARPVPKDAGGKSSPQPASPASHCAGVKKSQPAKPANNPSTSAGRDADSRLPEDFGQFMALAVTALGGTRATFVGMVLGRSQSATTETQLTTPQMAAAWAYVASLTLALLIWCSSPNCCDPAIKHLGQSFLGLVGEALTVMLNVAPQKAG